MGWTSPVLFRILGPKRFIELFLKLFTWRGSFYQLKPSDDTYDIYSVHHKYYSYESTDSFKDKSIALRSALDGFCASTLSTQHLETLSEFILSFTEEDLGEICYLFHIWKDNLLIPTKWSKKKIGVAWNVKTIFQEVLDECPDLKLFLKYGQNFRITMNRFNQGISVCTMDEGKFYRLIQSDSDELADDADMVPYDTNEAIWNTDYPVIPDYYGNAIVDEVKAENTPIDEEWIDDTPEFKRKYKVEEDDWSPFWDW